MLAELLIPLANDASFLNLFRYITFRTGGAIMTALLLSFWLGPKIIRWLKKLQQEGQPIRSDGPSSHLLTKKGTPTMGGLMILLSSTIATLLWMRVDAVFVWVALVVTLGYGLLGFIDDYLKLTKKNSRGLAGKLKLLGQLVFALIAVVVIQQVSSPDLQTRLAVPLFKDVLFNLGIFYLPFAVLVIIGASNAVNLTDGLDGLAIVPVMIAALSFAIIAYVVGNAFFANYLQLHFVPGSGELAIFCGAIIGASLGFLWYNAPPAQVFMGDTGSLALGGALGSVAVITKHEIVLAIIGGLFVVETLSVIIQVLSFKLTGKRVFLMAPIHHHFEKKGWSEPTIVIRFWIIAIILALIGLSTLKIR